MNDGRDQRASSTVRANTLTRSMNRWKNTSGSVSTAICALGRCPHCPFNPR